jgi:hypothetical protein
MRPVVVWNWYVQGNMDAQFMKPDAQWKVLRISDDGTTYQIEDVLKIGEQLVPSDFAGDRYFLPVGWAQFWVSDQHKHGVPTSNATAYDHVLTGVSQGAVMTREHVARLQRQTQSFVDRHAGSRQPVKVSAIAEHITGLGWNLDDRRMFVNWVSTIITGAIDHQD